MQLCYVTCMALIIFANSQDLQNKWQCPLEGITFYGNDAVCFKNIESWHECGALCDDMTFGGPCTIWTLQENYCCLKYSASGMNTCKDCFSGEKGCQ